MRALTLLILMLSNTAMANDCDTITHQDTTASEIFVACDSLERYNPNEIKVLIETIFSQYSGPPDETIVYFVSPGRDSTKGISAVEPTEFIGWYYTHCECGEYWPKIPSKTREYSLRREKGASDSYSENREKE